MSLDVYVKPYIPAWLIRVNEEDNVQHLIPPEPAMLDYAQYTASFSGSDVWRQDTEHSKALQESVLKGHVLELLRLLDLEETALIAQARSWNRYEVQLNSYTPPGFPARHTRKNDQTSPELMLYACKVKGIAEFEPRVLIHDEVEIRQLVPQQAKSDGFVLHARVKGVRRAQATLILESPQIFFHSGLFNLSFSHDKRVYSMLKETLRGIAEENTIRDAEGHKLWMTSHCFPEHKHCKLKTQLTHLRKFVWRDDNLNLEQMKAVQEIYEQRYGDMPYLIQGPPGTGKTKTVVEAIVQIFELNPEARIIACGASNTAADTLALRLIKHITDPKLLLRLNSHSRSFEEVPEPLLLYSCIQGDGFVLPPFETLMSKRIIVSTTTELLQLNKVKCNNQSLATLEKYVMSSLYPNHVQREPHVHFSHLFFDEAAQATESESICVLKIVEPSAGQRVSVVLTGDHKQLGPRVISDAARAAGLECSLFERLISRPCYSDHPLSRKNILLQPRPQLPFLYPAFTNLYRNYRSHPEILKVPSELSYNSSLMACATDVDDMADRLDMPVPVKFIGHREEDSAADISVMSSWYNAGEIAIIVAKVKELVEHGKKDLRPEQVSILAPFREHIVRLRLALRKVGLGLVGVGSVEDYQGAEARVVIISMVRSQARFLESDRKSGVGLIHARRRMNVALTRAKELLIVVGSPDIMLQDEHWEAWLKFCDKNGTYEGYRSKDFVMSTHPFADDALLAVRPKDFPMLGASRLIEQYSDHAMILAGRVAELLLEEDEY